MSGEPWSDTSNLPDHDVTECSAGSQFTVNPIASRAIVPERVPVTSLLVPLTLLVYSPENELPFCFVILITEPSSLAHFPCKSTGAGFLAEYNCSCALLFTVSVPKTPYIVFQCQHYFKLSCTIYLIFVTFWLPLSRGGRLSP